MAINVSIIFVVGENLRRKDLSFDHHNAMKLKSGEYGDKLIILAPTASIIGAIEAILYTGKFSITNTAPTSEFRY